MVLSSAFLFPFVLGGNDGVNIFDVCGVDNGVKLCSGFALVVGVPIVNGLRIS